MKKSLEISLTTVHLGSAKRITTLGINKKDQANDYLLTLAKSNLQGFQSILKRLQAIAEHDTFENKRTYRHVGDQVFEVKTTSGLRLYTFPDTIKGQAHQLIIAVCGGKKGNKKEQQADIEKAKQIKKDYLAAKKLASTQLKIVPLPDEN
ncbi:MAG: putative component of toxin-antitoxin plasmid stabilization module [Akkermansiaceae bacterium]